MIYIHTENKKIKTFITYIYSILTNDKIDMEMKKKLAYCIFTWAIVLWQGMFNFHTSLKSAFSLLIPVYTKPVSGTVTFFTFPSFLLASSKRTLIRKSIHFLVNWISTSYIPSFVLSLCDQQIGSQFIAIPDSVHFLILLQTPEKSRHQSYCDGFIYISINTSLMRVISEC